MGQSTMKNILAMGQFNFSLPQHWQVKTDLNFRPKQRPNPKPDVVVLPFDTIEHGKMVALIRKQAYFDGVKLVGCIQNGDVEVGLISLFSINGLDGLASAKDIRKVIEGLFVQRKAQKAKQPVVNEQARVSASSASETGSEGFSDRIQQLEKENQNLRTQIAETLSIYEAERAELQSTRFNYEEEIKSQRSEVQRLEKELADVLENFTSQKAEDANQQKGQVSKLKKAIAILEQQRQKNIAEIASIQDKLSAQTQSHQQAKDKLVAGLKTQQRLL